jgi:hypothetical protein
MKNWKHIFMIVRKLIHKNDEKLKQTSPKATPSIFGAHTGCNMKSSIKNMCKTSKISRTYLYFWRMRLQYEEFHYKYV